MLSVKAELSQSTITCVVYLPPLPTLSQIESLSNHLSQFQPSFNIILLGDFNLPNINWDTLTGISTVDNAFCDMRFQFNMLQLVYCPTHIHGNTLDLMLTNNDDLLDNISVCSNNNNPISSYHYPIVFGSSHARPLPTTNLSQHVYDYSKLISQKSIPIFLILTS